MTLQRHGGVGAAIIYFHIFDPLCQARQVICGLSNIRRSRAIAPLRLMLLLVCDPSYLDFVDPPNLPQHLLSQSPESLPSPARKEGKLRPDHHCGGSGVWHCSADRQLSPPKESAEPSSRRRMMRRARGSLISRCLGTGCETPVAGFDTKRVCYHVGPARIFPARSTGLDQPASWHD